MKVKDLMINLQKRNQESEVYLESNQFLLDISEVTFGEHEDEEFTVIIPKKEYED